MLSIVIWLFFQRVAQRKATFWFYYFLHRTVRAIQHRGDVTGTTPPQRLLLLASLAVRDMLEKKQLFISRNVIPPLPPSPLINMLYFLRKMSWK